MAAAAAGVASNSRSKRIAAVAATTSVIDNAAKTMRYGAPDSVLTRAMGLSNSLTEIAEMVFGKPAVDALKGSDMTVRSIYEHTSCDTQCNRVLPDEKGKGCWICGLPFVKEPGQCEHILPIIQAVMYLGLYRNKEDLSDEARASRMQLEYAWAHEKCNLIKLDDVYIGVRNVDGVEKFVPDNKKVENLLRQIWGKPTAYKHAATFDAQLRKVYKTDSALVGARAPPMIERLQLITDHLNSYNATGILVLLAAVNLRTEISEKAAPILGAAPPEPPAVTNERFPSPAEVFKRSIDEITSLIQNETGAKGLLGIAASNLKQDVIKTVIPACYARLVGRKLSDVDLNRVLKYIRFCVMKYIVDTYIYKHLPNRRGKVFGEQAKLMIDATVESLAAVDEFSIKTDIDNYISSRDSTIREAVSNTAATVSSSSSSASNDRTVAQETAASEIDVNSDADLAATCVITGDKSDNASIVNRVIRDVDTILSETTSDEEFINRINYAADEVLPDINERERVSIKNAVNVLLTLGSVEEIVAEAVHPREALRPLSTLASYVVQYDHLIHTLYEIFETETIVSYDSLYDSSGINSLLVTYSSFGIDIRTIIDQAFDDYIMWMKETGNIIYVGDEDEEAEAENGMAPLGGGAGAGAGAGSRYFRGGARRLHRTRRRNERSCRARTRRQKIHTRRRSRSRRR